MASTSDFLRVLPLAVGKYILFVHPAEFLVTARDGTIASRTILGDRLLIERDQVGGKHDSQRVFYYDLPLTNER